MRLHPDQPIVIADDSDEDYEITVEVLRGFASTRPILRLADGQEAQSFIAREGLHANVRRPALIMLDLSLPVVNGQELLLQIRASSWLRTVPVLINSTSSNPRDVELCYQRGANSYFVKPADFTRLERNLKAICDYWLELAATPGEGAGLPSSAAWR